VASPALVAALGLELHDPELGPSFVAQHLGFHLDLRHVLAVEHPLIVDEQQRLKRHPRTLVSGQPLDEQG
jgi:hypothetical protein